MSPESAMKHKKYWEMTAVELIVATKALEVPLVVDQSRALSPTEQEQWEEVQQERRSVSSSCRPRRAH